LQEGVLLLAFRAWTPARCAPVGISVQAGQTRRVTLKQWLDVKWQMCINTFGNIFGFFIEYFLNKSLCCFWTILGLDYISIKFFLECERGQLESSFFDIFILISLDHLISVFLEIVIWIGHGERESNLRSETFLLKENIIEIDGSFL